MTASTGYSFTDTTGDGATVTFPFSFVGPAPGYISKNQIFVYIRDSDVDSPLYGNYELLAGPYAFPSPNTVTLPGMAIAAPLDGLTNIRIRRIVDKTMPYADPHSDDIFRKTVLNNSFLQMLYSNHEALDGFIGGVLVTSSINMRGFIHYNLGRGSLPGHSVNFDQFMELSDKVDGIITGDLNFTVAEEALRRSYAEAGYDLIGRFSNTGLVVDDPTDVVLWELTGDAYAYSGGLPYTLVAGETPVGNPLWVPKSLESLRGELGGEGGASLVGGVAQIFSSVDSMKGFSVVAGRLYQTLGYYVEGDGGGALYRAVSGGPVPGGYGDHTADNGVFLLLEGTPTDLNHGVVVSDIYVAATAWNNRNAIQTMLRNQKWSYFEFVAKGTYYVLGSIHPLRSRLHINHKKGCKVIGRHDDPSIPASKDSQGGHMFGFVRYADPDNGVFLPVTEVTEKIRYVLDGDIETEYNATHHSLNNNNCIAGYKNSDCYVTGSGGVSGSDHRGVNFDGDAINCHIDIGYCDNVVDNGLMIQASNAVGNHCTIKVGRMGKMLAGGYNDPIAVRTQGGFSYDIEIGSFNGDNVIKPQLVGCYGSQVVTAKVGYVNGASCLLRQYETLNAEIEVEQVYNTPIGIIRAGATANKMRSARLHGIKLTDANFLAAYSDQVTSNRDSFARLTIDNNNFANAPSTFAFYNNRAAAGLPLRLDIHDNLPPSSFTAVEFNMHSMGITGNLATPGATSLAINYKSPDWNFGKMTIVATDAGGVRYEVGMDLRSRAITGQAVNYDIGTSGGFVATTLSGNTLTLTCTNCLLQIVTLHN